MGSLTWQEVAKILVTVSVVFGMITYTDLLGALFNLKGVSYTHSGDTVCGELCESYINVTTTYWRICFANYSGTKYEDKILFKKRSRSRTLHVNMDKIENIILTNPKVKVKWLVPTYGKYWRPIKDGDCWERGKTNRIKIVGFKKAWQTVKWGFSVGKYVNIDPTWFAKTVNMQVEKINISNQCLTDCYIYFRFKLNDSISVNSLDDFGINKTKFKSYMTDLNSWGFQIGKNVSYNVSVPIYGKEKVYLNGSIDSYIIYGNSVFDCDVGSGGYKKLVFINWSKESEMIDGNYTVCYDGKDKNGVFWNQTVIVGYNNMTKTKFKYVKFNPIGKTLHPDRWYYIKLWGKRKASLGLQAIDINPKLFGKTIHFSWWNSSWNYKKKIEVNKDNVNIDLDNFPMMVILNDSDLANHAQSDGDDIVFTNGSETVKLAHEIESYDGAGNLTAWVKVNLSSSSNTTIYMYYGNAVVGNQENPTMVWDSHYIGVWHFTETPTVDSYAYDSTSNDKNLNFLGSMTSSDQVGGLIDGSLDFDGTDDNLDRGDYDLIDNANDLTWEVWVKFNVIGTDDGLMGKHASGTDGFIFWRDQTAYISGRTNVFTIILYDYGSTNAVRIESDSVAGTANVWYYVAATWIGGSSTGLRMYINGSEDPYSPKNSALVDSVNSGTYDFRIGTWGDGTRPTNGVFTEARVSDISRGANWINTTWLNMRYPTSFYSVGSEETSGVGSTCDCSSIQSGTTIDCTENCNINSNCDANGQNIVFSGSGTITLTANITNHGDVSIKNNCHVICNGGCFKT